jgi:hypothetical protein
MLAIAAYKIPLIYVGFVVLTEVAVKSIMFWNMILYILIEIHRRFGGTCCFLLRGVSRASNQWKASSKQRKPGSGVGLHRNRDRTNEREKKSILC